MSRMSRSYATLRLNEATNDWVVCAPSRGTRPKQFAPPPPTCSTHAETTVPDCPFCAGSEATTPDAVLTLPRNEAVDAAYPPGEGPDWRLRVVPNKFPVVAHDTTTAGKVAAADLNVPVHGLEVPAYGFHEVIVESPVHCASFASGYPSQARDVLGAFQARVAAYEDDPHLRYITMFKNQGHKAGASLAHPHSQCVGLPITPFEVLSRVETATRYHAEHNCCVFCTMLEKELAGGERVVVENDSVVAFVPFAAISPFQTWIVPKVHTHMYTALEPHVLDDFAAALVEVSARLDVVLNTPDFNMVIHQAPYHTPDWFFGEPRLPDAFHVYAEIIPRLGPGMLAGFEFGSGMSSNANSQEQDAEDLRQAQL